MFNNHHFYLAMFIFFLTACAEEQSDPVDALNDRLPANLVEHAQTNNTNKNLQGRLVFRDTLHDFGRLIEGETVEYDFEFTNKGTKDLLISEAKATCGCTVPAFPEYPIKKDASDKIRVTFNSQGKQGFNEKVVMVRTNGDPAVYNLYIRAEVTAAQ